jgi:spermidine synthase
MAWLLVAGFVSTLGQVIVLREINVAFYGVELVYVLAIGAWLIGAAVGAAADRGRPTPPSVRAVATLVALTTVLVVGDVVFLRGSRRAFGGVSGAYLPFTSQLAALLLATIPVGALSGLIFQWTARRLVSRDRSLPVAYAVESAGALVGGVTAVLVVRAGLQTFTVATALMLLGAALALAASAEARLTRLAWGLVLAFAVGSAASSNRLDQAMTRWNHPHLVESRDSPYGRVTLTRFGEQVTVFENDALSFETGSVEPEILAHLALLNHRNPSSVLMLGGWTDGVAREIGRHRLGRLDVVEANQVLVAMGARHLAGARPGSSATTRLVVNEPRRALLRAAPVDVIVVSQPEPDSGQANRFYTREFFGLCARRLNPGGVLAFRLHTPEDFWTPAQVHRMVSIRTALAAAFRHTTVLPAGMSLLLASNEPLTEDVSVLASRLKERGLVTRLVSPSFLRYVYANDRREQVDRLAGSAAAEVNTDAHPICYRHALLLWLGRFSPSLARLDAAALAPGSALRRRLQVGGLGALAAVLVMLRALRRAARCIVMVGAAAAAGMLLETALLVQYQVKSGVIYQDIGVLIATFMLGLSAGTLVTAGAGEQFPQIARSRGAGVAIASTLAALGAAVWLLVGAGRAGDLTTASVLIAADGGLTGAMFAWASVFAGLEQRRIVGPLYAADLAGGCVGAVLGGLVLVPLFGLDGAALGAAVAALLAAAGA